MHRKKMNSTQKFLHSFIAIFLLVAVPAVAQQKLTLEECRTMALEQNKKVKIAQEDVKAATYTKKAAGTHYLPKLSLSGGYLRTNKDIKPLNDDLFLPIVPYNTIDPTTGKFNSDALQDPQTALNTIVMNPETGQPVLDASGNPVFKNYAMLPADQLKFDNNNYYYARLSVNQPLFTGLKITESNKMAQYAENISREQVVLTQAEVLTQTDEAYWRVVSLQEKVKLAHSYRDLLNRLVTDLENMYSEGIITKNDLLKAQVKQNDANLQVLKAENGLELSKMALAQIIGLNYESVDITENIIEAAAISTVDLSTRYSADNRAEVNMLKEKVNIMQANKNIERSKFMPTILLTGGYGFMNPNPYNGLRNEFGGDWSVGVVVSMPVFTWGERKHNMNIASVKKHQAQYELEEARELIDLQIHQNRFKHIESLKKVEMTKLSKDQAEENMRVAEDNLAEGRTRLSELLEAQVQWSDAYSEYIDAMVEVKTTQSELEKSTGQIYEQLKN